MTDPIKHTFGTIISGMGLFGSITLVQVNLLVSITCGLAGIVAACCTINSWWIKRKKFYERSHLKS